MADDPQYTTRQLVKVVDALDRPKTHLLDTFFPDMILFDTEKIDFDKIPNYEGLAPFVAPSVRGRLIGGKGFTTRSYQPAYVKPKEPIDPTRAFKRRPGEQIGGDMTAGTRYNAALVDMMDQHRAMVIRRKEWMAAKALYDGKVIVVGEDFPEQIVDFGRDPDLTVVLPGGSKWGDAGVNPLRELEAYAAAVQDASGAIATKVTMTPDVWAVLSEDEKFLAGLDNRRAASGLAELGPTVTGTEEESARYMGTHGDFDFWTYNDSYVETDVNGNDVRHRMLPPGTLLLAGKRLEGVQCHGAIRDKKANLLPLEVFFKVIEEDDPAVEYLLTQSAPLVVPARPNASMRVTVL